jgi:Putative Flp pilus-assembly TadE/G-like
MSHRMDRVVAARELVASFINRSDGSIAPTFALAFIPILATVGAAMDYSNANLSKTALQAVLDNAVIRGAQDGGDNWRSVALAMFRANLALKNMTAPDPTFTLDSVSAIYSGSVGTTVPTSVMGVFNVQSIPVSARSSAKAIPGDNSCILTLDKGQSTSHVSLDLNGAPVVNLSGCSIRSNTSIACNGHDGDNTKSIAAGGASGCQRPKPNSPIVPDIYAALASNITSSCGSSRPGVSWEPGTLPTGAGFITVSKATHVEYHVCGDLDLSGTGYLTGSAPTTDSVIVIENGNLNVADNASVNTKRTAIVMTGNNTFPSRITFPNGNGKSATLSLSPPTSSTNPWQGVALFQDPVLTNNVDNNWGPGAAFNADGLVYLGNSNVVTDGNTASSNAKCSKFVMNQFRTNGSVSLDFDQSVAACSAIGLKQWGGVIVHLVR